MNIDAPGSSVSSDGLGVSRGLKTPIPLVAAHREQRHLVSIPYAYWSKAHLPTTAVSSLPTTPIEQDDTGLDLPPLRFSTMIGPNPDNVSFPILPSVKKICESTPPSANPNAVALLTKCGCGSMCICPACQQWAPRHFLPSCIDTFCLRRHDGAELAALSREERRVKHVSCINYTGELAPPSIKQASSAFDSSRHHSLARPSHSHTHEEHPSASMSTLDHFNAVAALLPPPPTGGRKFGPGTLDPTNVVVYPQHSGTIWRKATGLVQLPPLNCCSGRCKCPSGMCGCGTECGGSCGQRSVRSRNAKGNGGENADVIAEGARKKTGQTVGFCANKRPPIAVAALSSSLRP